MASVVWGTKTILERFSPPPAVVVENTGTDFTSKLEQRHLHVVDPWLPRVGREINGRQIVGGLLFMPLLVGPARLGPAPERDLHVVGQRTDGE